MTITTDAKEEFTLNDSLDLDANYDFFKNSDQISDEVKEDTSASSDAIKDLQRQLKMREKIVRGYAHAARIYAKLASLPLFTPEEKEFYNTQSCAYLKKLSWSESSIEAQTTVYLNSVDSIKKAKIFLNEKYNECCETYFVAEKLAEAYDTAADHYDLLALDPQKKTREKYHLFTMRDQCSYKARQSLNIVESYSAYTNPSVDLQIGYDNEHDLRQNNQKCRACIEKLSRHIDGFTIADLHNELSEITALKNELLHEHNHQLKLEENKSLTCHLFAITDEPKTEQQPVITRYQIKEALARIGKDIDKRDINAKSLIIFLENYIKLPNKKTLSHFFKLSDPKVKNFIANLFLLVLTKNETVTLKYSELGLLINGGKFKSSLLKKILDKFIRIDELAGFRKAVNQLCVRDTKDVFHLDKLISPDSLINMNQTEASLHGEQKVYNTKMFSSYFSPPC